MAAWDTLGSAGAGCLVVGLLGHIWILLLEQPNLLPLVVLLGLCPLVVIFGYLSLLRVELYALSRRVM